MQSLPRLCQYAIDAARNTEWRNFGVQTNFERALLAREEAMFDEEPTGAGLAIKNQANRLAADFIEKKTGKKNARDADITMRLDFTNLSALAIPSSIYVFGHYLKKSREYCQHTWACTACRGRGCKKCDYKKVNYPSVEDAVCSAFLSAFEAKSCLFHACGREDIDVMMLGTGRPFVVEIKEPKKRNVAFEPIVQKIKSSSPIEILNPFFVPSFWIESVCNSHFDKHYCAIVEASRPIVQDDFKKIHSSLPLVLRQRTPVRVARRRADMVRIRHVRGISLSSLEGGKIQVLIHAEAGTYIKELINGDNGRTKPSFCSILGIECKCSQLDVVGIDDDFIKTLRRH